MVDPKRVREHLILSVDSKLERAKVQVEALTEAISGWGARSPITTRGELREGRLGFRLIVEDFVEPPITIQWGLLVGECVHNLRSALDNLAFALARLRCDPPPKPSQISFPLFSDKTLFKKKARTTLEQLPDGAVRLIESIQPFNRDGSSAMGSPESDSLVLLQWLNNADKHRVPSVVLIGQLDATHEASIEYYSEEDAAANSPPDTIVWSGALHPGVILLELRTKSPVAKVSTSFKVRATVAVETHLGQPSVIVVMQSLRYYTTLVVDQFRSLFAE
jgi:hypothetical protein